MIAIAVIGWLLALLGFIVAANVHTLLKKAWEREDWYRDQFLRANGHQEYPPEVVAAIRVTGIN